MAVVKWNAGAKGGDTKPMSVPEQIKTKFAKSVGGDGFCGADPFSFSLTTVASSTFVCVDKSVLTVIFRVSCRAGLGTANFVTMFTLKLTS
jgi:hypothetical protein